MFVDVKNKLFLLTKRSGRVDPSMRYDQIRGVDERGPQDEAQGHWHERELPGGPVVLRGCGHLDSGR